MNDTVKTPAPVQIMPHLIGAEAISREDLAAMYEYSCTTPSRAELGFRWRCAFNGAGRHDQEDTEWVICTYVADPREERRALIHWCWAVDGNGKRHVGYLRP